MKTQGCTTCSTAASLLTTTSPSPLNLPLPCSSSAVDPGGRVEYCTPDTSFTHLTVHSGAGEVYVGAVNQVLKLSSDLTLLRSHETGPVEDNDRCYPPPSVQTCAHRLYRHCLHTTLGRSDNVNKLLLVDYSENRLLACGTKWQGVCQFLRLDDLFNLGEPHLQKEHYVSGGSDPNGMAGLILDKDNRGSNPDSQKPVQGNSRLYIGASVSRTHQYYPSLSHRKLLPDVDSNDMLSLVYQDEFVSSQIKIPEDTLKVYPDFNIHYVYTFSSGFYVYFVTLQLDTELTPKSSSSSSCHCSKSEADPGRETFYTTKIVRMCSDDPKFFSYVEFPLGCTKDGVDYRVVQAAFKQKPGKKLALQLGLGEDEDVLLVLFSQGQQNRSNTDTVLCLFTLRDINQAITEKIRSCYRGMGRLSVPWLLGKELSCITAPVEIGEHFCGMDFNQPLGGDRVIQGHPLHQDRTQGMGAVAGCTYGEDTLIFVGTRTGHLKKLRVDSASNSQDALLYETLNVTEREPILRDMGLSPDCRFIYVLSQNQVTRLPVESCDRYSSCSECVGSRDPHCSWCLLSNK
uniref:Sema domain-containing protein n=1 Tax=Knipowitschia caucasica TaxID=637954 RepID=A0AAV2KQA1_KNICA